MFSSLAPGKILVDYGPISMVIEAYRNGQPLDRAAEAGGQAAVRQLQELTRYLYVAKRLARQVEPREAYPAVLNMMIEATRATGEPDVTPMAAVAGSIADAVLATLVEHGATKAIVNNGGDIAIRVESSEPGPVRVGIITDLAAGVVTHSLDITQASQIGGIATSGLGGRSFTKGIASSVVALAETAARADACATMLANAVNADHPAIARTRAELIDPLTDIRGQLVTVEVGELDNETVSRAMQAGQRKFFQYQGRGLLLGVIMAVRGRVWMHPRDLAGRIVC